MTALVLNHFPPLQGAITQAESWTRYLHGRRPELGIRRAEELGATVEAIVCFGIKLGELLPVTWRLTFDNLLRPGEASWTTVPEWEASRQAVRLLFFTAREALDMTRQVAEALQSRTGRPPAEMERLLGVIEQAGQLEEAVFRDWPSFAEPLPSLTSGAALSVDESLAEALGVTVGEARQRMDDRRRERSAERG